MAWLREDADQDWHPRVRAAGFLGAVVWRAIKRACKQWGKEGELPPHHSAPEVLAERLGRGCTPEMIIDGLRAAEAAGLVTTGNDGCVTVTGWSDRQWNPSDEPERVRERVRRHRERKRAESQARGDVTPSETTCNGRNDDRTGQDGTGRDRSESELPRAARPAPPAPLPTLEPDPELTTPARPPAKPRKSRKVPDSGHRAILAAYVQAHMEHRGIAPAVAGPEVAAVKAMRKARPADVETTEAWDDELVRLVDLYVASTDEWREKQGWGLRFMPGQITKLRQEARGIDADYPEWQRKRDEEIDRRVTAQQAADAAEAALESAHTRPNVDAETRAAMRADFEALQAAEAERQAAREAETEVGLRAALDATQAGDRTW